ncbi:MAG: hypothetical protein ACREOI_02520 [bacterium]
MSRNKAQAQRQIISGMEFLWHPFEKKTVNTRAKKFNFRELTFRENLFNFSHVTLQLPILSFENGAKR